MFIFKLLIHPSYIFCCSSVFKRIFRSCLAAVSEKNGPQTQNQQKSSPPHSTSPHSGLLGNLSTTASSTATSASSGAPVASGSSSPEAISADEQTQTAVHLVAAANIALQHHQPVQLHLLQQGGDCHNDPGR